MRTIGRRFLLQRLLQSGQGMDTWLCADNSTGGQAVVKVVPVSSVPASIRHRQEWEAAQLEAVRGPVLNPPAQVGVEQDTLFFASPFLSGLPLQQLLRQRGRLGVIDVLALGVCLLRALRDTHCSGALHRHVKPSSIIVNEEKPLPRATLTDYGLARLQLVPEGSTGEELLASLRYLAPEQAGLIDASQDERSDLFSAGVVLYECLAGQPPFSASTVSELLRRQLGVHPPDLRSLGVEVPRALEQVIKHLIKKEPRDRYQSAEGALVDLEEILEALEKGEKEPLVVIGRNDVRLTLTEPGFVGRTEELSDLLGYLDRTSRGEGGVVILEANSGVGKTRLMEEFAARVSGNTAIFRGRGLANAAPQPYQELAGVAGDMVYLAQAEPGWAERFGEQLAEQRDAVISALPELTGVLGASREQAIGPEAFGQHRSMVALAALLESLGSKEKPALVLLDDAQWIDALTLKLLQHWTQHSALPDGGNDRTTGRISHGSLNRINRYTLVIASFRSEDVPPNHPLRFLPGVDRLILPPFRQEEVALLVESMAGPLPAEAVEVVQELAVGNPFMASSVLQGMVESGALVRNHEWRVDAEALRTVRSSRQAGAYLAKRVTSLPADCLLLLQVGAVLGREFELDLAARLSELPAERVRRAIDEARRRHFVWDRASARYVFVHEKLREALLARQQGGFALYRLGYLRGAGEVAKSVFEEGRDLGALETVGVGLDLWSKASCGRVPEALLAAELRKPTQDIQTRVELLQAEAVRLLTSGQVAGANAVLVDAREVLERSGVLNEYIAPVYMWLATSLRVLQEQETHYSPRRSMASLREALRFSKKVVRIARKYRNNLSHALREQAYLVAMAGRHRQARRLFRESLRMARQMQMRQEEALTLQAMGRVGQQLDWADAEVDLATGEGWLREAEAERGEPRLQPAALSLADRFDRLLAVGRNIAVSFSKQTVLAAVEDAGLSLLRGEYAFVIEADDRGEPKRALPVLIDQVILIRARDEMRPVLLAEGAAEEPTDMLTLVGVRAVLCAPIFVRNKVAAWWYVTHTQIGRLFGEAESRLAEFVSALAAATLEAIQGVSKIQALSEERARLLEEASAAVRSRDAFLSMASHELRTPLTSLSIGIQALSSRLKKGWPVGASELEIRLETYSRQTRRLTMLINDLLDLSRITAGKLTLNLVEMDLAELCRDMIERFGEESRRADTPINLSVPESVVGHWDPLRLESILGNLLTNAMKFGRGRPIEVDLHEEDDRVLLKVRDHGLGIAPEDQARIFEPFERAVSSEHYGGLGLGLWIVRDIIEAHGGRIMVESWPDQGSEFTVILPKGVHTNGKGRAPTAAA